MSTHADSGAPVTPVTPTLLRNWPLPGPGEGKNDRGTVLVIGGARRTPGAAMLAGVAALRAGAGRLSFAVAESTAVQLALAVPEAGARGLPESADGSVLGRGAQALAQDWGAADAVVIGPGLDDAQEAGALLEGLLAVDQAQPGDRPAVLLDAFALGALPGLGDSLNPWAGRLILTPNPSEAQRLLGRAPDDLGQDLAALADKYGAVVSCQGLIAAPEGEGLWEITTGYGGLGTSGSGDVLVGAIAGLRARGATATQAACWGTHLHAAAGDRLAGRRGMVGYLAGELATELPTLLMELHT